MKEDVRDGKQPARDEESAPFRPTRLPDGLGLAESFLVTGRDAGFDMTSQEGVAAWSSEIKRRIMQGNPLEKSLPRAESSETPPVQPSESPSRKRPAH